MAFWSTLGRLGWMQWCTSNLSICSGINDPTTTPSSKRRTATVRVNDAVMEEIKGVTADMGASDWRDRHKGITHFQEMTESNPEVIGNSIVKVSMSLAQYEVRGLLAPVQLDSIQYWT